MDKISNRLQIDFNFKLVYKIMLKLSLYIYIYIYYHIIKECYNYH